MRVFILGAGFSTAAGFPLANKLIEFISDFLRNNTNIMGRKDFNDLIDFFQEIRKHFPWLGNDIEQLFTYIDLADLSGNPGFFALVGYNDIAGLRKIRQLFPEAMRYSFCQLHYNFLHDSARIGNEKIIRLNSMYWKFFNWLEPGDVIITFNYDCLTEKGLWQRGLWTFLDGYGISKNRYAFENYPNNKCQKSQIKILKLHGSLTWRYSDTKREIYFINLNDCIDDGLTFWEKGFDQGYSETLIIPSFVKGFDSIAFLNLWDQAYGALSRCNEIITIGYSLPPADAYARIFLSNAIRSNPQQKVTVIGPDETPSDREGWDKAFRYYSVWDRFDKILGFAVKREIMCFEQWVQEKLS